MKTTATHFDISEVAADKAYLSRWNMETVEAAGGTPCIPFKSNTVIPRDDSIWARMYHLFMFNREEFLRHYHQRSNAEPVFSMMKSKFGDSVRAKSEVGRSTKFWRRCYVIICAY